MSSCQQLQKLFKGAKPLTFSRYFYLFIIFFGPSVSVRSRRRDGVMAERQQGWEAWALLLSSWVTLDVTSPLSV